MERYLRLDYLPTLFCPGCGNGIIQYATIAAIDKLRLRDDIACVSGIGCSSWIPCYFNMDVMHTIHGRALAFAQGLKLARPVKNVLVFTGDGDCLAIGGNHLLHACKRNINLTVIMVNNHIYGMTGGQKSPATPLNCKTKTSSWGTYDEPIQGAELAINLGATYVARWTTAHPVQLQKSIEAGIKHRGLSFIEVISQCPTQSGKSVYGSKDPAYILNYLKENSSIYKEGMEHLEGKIKCGVLWHDNDRLEYIERMKGKIWEYVETKALGGYKQ
ncbi:MAG: 2-oxoacid:ferredoxin oxidoreductase subunit beta [Clostridiales bacterium]|jgi:2-oxoglutarate ferredoxin oxidoreductase subunit beta|nr:2-oxoacid:ferredoxin oxidoreductase subunit beta [Clostridiales bacterium]